MIDLLKYSKKNLVFRFIINKILGIKINNISNLFFYKDKIDLKVNTDFFYNYKNELPETKWSGKNPGEHYQSNHDLQNYKEFNDAIQKLENFLNNKFKKEILKFNFMGKFKIKSLWFTIQKTNQGHPKHNHPKSIFSGVYYHSIEKEKGGEIEIFIDDKKTTHKLEKNDLLIFHSDTFHSVKPYFGEKDRIAIAWDAIYTF